MYRNEVAQRSWPIQISPHRVFPDFPYRRVGCAQPVERYQQFPTDCGHQHYCPGRYPQQCFQRGTPCRRTGPPPGEPYGSLILSLSVVILEVSLISALMATGDAAPALMRDTLYSIIMIVTAGLVGVALLLGGRKFATQYVNLGGIKQYLMAILPLAVIVLVLPSALPGGNFSVGQSLLVAAISAAMYGVFLLIQTKTHQSLFVYEHEDDDGDPHHGKPSSHSSLWHAAWLIVHLVAVIAVTKFNANPLEGLLTKLNAPTQFTGFLVALLILSPEGWRSARSVEQSGAARHEPVLRLGAGDHFTDGASGNDYCHPDWPDANLWPAGTAYGSDADGVDIVPYLVLYRQNQRVERHRAPGTVCRLYDDDICLIAGGYKTSTGRIICALFYL